jgi:hypothetical protein
MWNLVLIYFEIMLASVQDRCTVCIERTIGHKQFWSHPMELVSDVGRVELVLVHLEIELVSVQGWSTVCTEHTIGIEIILDDLDQTPM